MGRLFWKFFLCILLAQVTATIGTLATVWLRDQARSRGVDATLDVGPPGMIMLDAARATLTHAGIDGLRALAASSRRMRLYVLDDKGHDLLGRRVSTRLREEVARNLGDDNPARPVARLTGPDGRKYVAFASRIPRSAPDALLQDASRIEAGGGAIGTVGTLGTVGGMRSDDRGGRDGRMGSGTGAGMGAGMGPGAGPGFGPGPMGGGMGGGFGLPPHVGRWFGIVAAMLASLLFAALLAWYFSRPIRALRRAFESAAAGDLAPKFGHAKFAVGGDELAELGHDFDRMSAQLRALMDGQRRLLHDVSHELRSPLARLQAAIGLAHQQPDKIQASLERIERESVRMDRLVGELLTLARLEAATALPAQEPVDLVELVDGVADDARFEAGARIDVHAPLPFTVTAAPDLLWSAVENIVRNAVKHGSGGAVEVALHAEGDRVHIDVLDRGPGIAPEHLGDIFEPFFRSNPTMNHVDGHGLGLAIARRVVDSHGGAITAANRLGGGLRVTIALPLRSGEPA